MATAQDYVADFCSRLRAVFRQSGIELPAEFHSFYADDNAVMLFFEAVVAPHSDTIDELAAQEPSEDFPCARVQQLISSLNLPVAVDVSSLPVDILREWVTVLNYGCLIVNS